MAPHAKGWPVETIPPKYRVLEEEIVTTPHGDPYEVLIIDEREDRCLAIGVSRSDGLHRFIVELPEKALVPPLDRYTSVRGWRVDLSPRAMRPNFISLIVTATERVYNDVFNQMIDDVAAKLHRASANELVAVLLARLNYWCRAFSLRPSGVLTVEQQRGLIGELTVLDQLLSVELTADRVIDAWKGPDREQQDFVFDSSVVAIEVKSVGSEDKVQIASEHQLNDAGLKACFLAIVRLTPSDDGGTSLKGVVSRIRGVIGGARDLDRFNAKLMDAGYYDHHDKHYESPSYMTSLTAYKVRQGMPRLVAPDLLPGVSGVQYAVSLASLTEFACAFPELIQALEG